MEMSGKDDDEGDMEFIMTPLKELNIVTEHM
jgi:hypothetical protein